jgi:hypothetical protein
MPPAPHSTIAPLPQPSPVKGEGETESSEKRLYALLITEIFGLFQKSQTEPLTEAKETN